MRRSCCRWRFCRQDYCPSFKTWLEPRYPDPACWLKWIKYGVVTSDTPFLSLRGGAGNVWVVKAVLGRIHSTSKLHARENSENRLATLDLASVRARVDFLPHNSLAPSRTEFYCDSMKYIVPIHIGADNTRTPVSWVWNSITRNLILRLLASGRLGSLRDPKWIDTY